MTSTKFITKAGASERGSLLWVPLTLGLVAATLIPIGIHTVLLDDLGVPYPAALPHAGPAILPDHILLLLGIVSLDGTLRRLRSASLAIRLTFLVLTVAAINQALLRLPVMRNVVSTKWTIYPFIDNVPEVARLGTMVLAAVVINLMFRRYAPKIICAVVATAVIDLWFSPLLRQAFAGIVASNTKREGDQLYNVPYDWHVNVPSYITYIEPAAAALIVGLALRRAKMPLWMSICVIFAIQGGPLFRLPLNTLYAPSSPAVAILSEGQFTLQALALASIAVLTSRRSLDRLSNI